MKNILLLFLFLLNQGDLKKEAAPAVKTINVQAYGAKGDGQTDDYRALLAAVAALNAQGGGQLYFPKGHYLIKAYHQKGKLLENIVIKNSKNIDVQGTGAIIEVFGQFHRAVDRRSGRYSYSQTSSIIPLAFINCQQVNIKGLEIRGQVNLMTRDKGLNESGGHLLTFNQCSNVTVEDVYVHHAQTDGIYITKQCKDFKFNRVRSANNARQGMSIIELSNGRFENCQFTGTGFTGGKYGGHNPQAGVDIEPHAKSKQIATQISFYQCTFSGNAGPQFVCSKPATTSHVTLDQCTLAAGKGKYAYQIIISGKDISIKNSQIDLGKGSIYPIWARYSGSEVQILNCDIKGSGKGIVAVSNDPKNRLLLQGNRLSFTGSKLNGYFPHLQMQNLQFLNNTVHIPAGSIAPGKVTSLVQKGAISSGNTFRSGQSRVVPKVSYQGTKKVKDQ